jgi:hypothetical protein
MVPDGRQLRGQMRKGGWHGARRAGHDLRLDLVLALVLVVDHDTGQADDQQQDKAG